MLRDISEIFLAFLCYKDSLYVPECDTMNPGPKETNALRWINKIKDTGSCYRIILEKKMSYYLARPYCDKFGAELLVIDNEVEHAVVKDILSEVDYRLKENQFFFTDLFRENDYRVDWKCNCHLFQTRYNESIHEVGYEPWAEGKNFLTKSQWDDAAIIVRASDGIIVEKAWYQWSYPERKPFCEKRITPPPFY
ncbi:uncharacterized protein LOC125240593 isoform X2 [Leguminivora glycinivorella]|uniref:uncharacterized protein LOC125240593 isoform X2 n=1 Tax=Leguminivora glycinivorella TaxID=1035111 RepID=UPI00200F7F69|nr:uncharacterized protein LOC125240593 isoform X2 [Leguminivora glycinivorella]